MPRTRSARKAEEADSLEIQVPMKTSRQILFPIPQNNKVDDSQPKKRRVRRTDHEIHDGDDGCSFISNSNSIKNVELVDESKSVKSTKTSSRKKRIQLPSVELDDFNDEQNQQIDVDTFKTPELQKKIIKKKYVKVNNNEPNVDIENSDPVQVVKSSKKKNYTSVKKKRKADLETEDDHSEEIPQISEAIVAEIQNNCGENQQDNVVSSDSEVEFNFKTKNKFQSFSDFDFKTNEMEENCKTLDVLSDNCESDKATSKIEVKENVEDGTRMEESFMKKTRKRWTIVHDPEVRRSFHVEMEKQISELMQTSAANTLNLTARSRKRWSDKKRKSVSAIEVSSIALNEEKPTTTKTKSRRSKSLTNTTANSSIVKETTKTVERDKAIKKNSVISGTEAAQSAKKRNSEVVVVQQKKSIERASNLLKAVTQRQTLGSSFNVEKRSVRESISFRGNRTLNSIKMTPNEKLEPKSVLITNSCRMNRKRSSVSPSQKDGETGPPPKKIYKSKVMSKKGDTSSIQSDKEKNVSKVDKSIEQKRRSRSLQDDKMSPWGVKNVRRSASHQKLQSEEGNAYIDTKSSESSRNSVNKSISAGNNFKRRETFELKDTVNELEVLKSQANESEEAKRSSSDRRNTFGLIKPFHDVEFLQSSSTIAETDRENREIPKRRDTFELKEPVNDITLLQSLIENDNDDERKSESFVEGKRRETFELEKSVHDPEFLQSLSTLPVSEKRGSILKRRDTYELDRSVTDVSLLKSISEGNLSDIGVETLKNDSSCSETEEENAVKTVRFQHVTMRRRSKRNAEIGGTTREEAADPCVKKSIVGRPLRKSISFDQTLFVSSTPLRLAANQNDVPQKSSLLKRVLTRETHQSKRRSRSNEECGRVSKIKMPNFARIHQKASDRLENIAQWSERRAERAKLLLSGQKPEASSTIERDDRIEAEKKAARQQLAFDKTIQPSTSSSRPVVAVERKNSVPQKKVAPPQKKVAPPQKKVAPAQKKVAPAQKNAAPSPKNVSIAQNGVARARKPVPAVGGEGARRVADLSKAAVKSRYAVNSKKESNENNKAQQILSIKKKVVKPTHGQDLNSSREMRRDEIKGVRGNRRFELLMQMRKNGGV